MLWACLVTMTRTSTSTWASLISNAWRTPSALCDNSGRRQQVRASGVPRRICTTGNCTDDQPMGLDINTQSCYNASMVNRSLTMKRNSKDLVLIVINRARIWDFLKIGFKPQQVGSLWCEGLIERSILNATQLPYNLA